MAVAPIRIIFSNHKVVSHFALVGPEIKGDLSIKRTLDRIFLEYPLSTIVLFDIAKEIE